MPLPVKVFHINLTSLVVAVDLDLFPAAADVTVVKLLAKMCSFSLIIQVQATYLGRKGTLLLDIIYMSIILYYWIL